MIKYNASSILQIEIDYVQCTDLDIDAILDTTNVNPEKTSEVIPDLHKPTLDTDAIKEAHQGFVFYHPY